MPHEDGGPGVIWTPYAGERKARGTPLEFGFSVPQSFQTKQSPLSAAEVGRAGPG